ncbi:helix-hairpin-helix domain-containing protein [Micromonospora sp. NPDC006766]|uniref:helix-hairpin-helix domain-containing protein n=1 Tax=Micromonospora sp. NPDC006766 TaxID=3154778 RepID=UPI0033DE16A1
MSTGPDGGWPTYPAGPPPTAYGPGGPATPIAGTNPAGNWRWRLLHSWWLLLPALGCGCLGGFGFIYVGIRARRPAWWISGIGYALLGWAAFAIVGSIEEKSVLSQVAVAATLLIWIGGVVHALLINSAWLRWQANHRPWYQQPAGWSATGYPSEPIAPPPAAPWEAPPAPPAVPWDAPPPLPLASPPAQSTVDVNTATAAQLAALPGFDSARVHRVLAERDSRRGFGSVAEFVAAADLAPHEYARLRDMLTCVPPTDLPPPGQPRGRVLDF